MSYSTERDYLRQALEVSLPLTAVRILEERGWDHRGIEAVLSEVADLLRATDNATRLQGEHEVSVSPRDRNVVVRFRLRGDADLAADLSWRLAEAMVENGLDRPGLVVSFATATRQPA
jgi:hypothetical protein